MNLRIAAYLAGNIVSAMIGAWIGFTHGAEIGIAVWYAMSMLVDIRDKP